MQSAARNLNKTYDATPGAVADARARVTDFARAAGATREQLDAVRLAVSEAVSNGVLHAYRNGEAGSIHVAAAVVSGELSVLVADDGWGLKPRTDRGGLGLGLGLISQVSDDFAIVSRPSGGTEVRIRFSLPYGAAEGVSRATGRERHIRHRMRPSGFTPSMSPV